MNLRIDLILESEQRSASVVNLKMIRRLAMVVVPVLLGTIVLFSVLGTMRLGARAAELESRWSALEPQRDAALARVRQIGRHTAILNALESWPETKLTLHDQLAAIMAMMPDTIQITQLTFDQPISQTTGRDRAREPTLRMQGRSRGEDSERMILLLEKRFGETEPLAKAIKSLSMRGSGDTSADALPTDRIFTIVSDYHPRSFKQ